MNVNGDLYISLTKSGACTMQSHGKVVSGTKYRYCLFRGGQNCKERNKWFWQMKTTRKSAVHILRSCNVVDVHTLCVHMTFLHLPVVWRPADLVAIEWAIKYRKIHMPFWSDLPCICCTPLYGVFSPPWSHFYFSLESHFLRPFSLIFCYFYLFFCPLLIRSTRHKTDNMDWKFGKRFDDRHWLYERAVIGFKASYG